MVELNILTRTLVEHEALKNHLGHAKSLGIEADNRQQWYIV